MKPGVAGNLSAVLGVLVSLLVQAPSGETICSKSIMQGSNELIFVKNLEMIIIIINDNNIITNLSPDMEKQLKMCSCPRKIS